MKKILIIALLLWANLSFASSDKTSSIETKASIGTKLTNASDPIVSSKVDNDSTENKTTAKNKNFELSVMPYISYNRTMEGMFGALPMMTYRFNKNDSISPKSMAMIGGVWTTNGSWFTNFASRTYFGEGNWRTFLVFMNGKQNASTSFNSTASGGKPFEADYSNRMIFFLGSVQYQVLPHLFAGVNGRFMNSRMEYSDKAKEGYDASGNQVSDSKANIVSLGLVANYDTRNDQYYPTAGINTKIQWMTNPEAMNDFTANRIFTEYNTYYAMHGGRDVLAARYNGQFGVGDVIFQQQKTIGGKDLRGYSSGKYRGDGIIDVQAEYRYNPFDRVGFVGFAGIATLYGSSVEEYNWKAYPGAGVGVRYRAFKSTKMNIGVDAAVGKEDWGIYFRIAEAF
ncbi:MAG: BamA/TamA family outer membrane protein [Mangrovibacterium sp.]